MTDPPQDDDLALAVHRGQRGALERLVDRFEPALHNYANRILADAFDAQEVVQDTFVRAHDALTRRYDAERARDLALKPWLFRIARNLALNKRVGSRGRRVERPLSELDDARVEALELTGAVSEAVEREQERAAVERALARLPADGRELIVLRFMEEMSYAEISRVVGQTEAALRGRVFRSLRLLREALAENEAHHAM